VSHTKNQSIAAALKQQQLQKQQQQAQIAATLQQQQTPISLTSLSKVDTHQQQYNREVMKPYKTSFVKSHWVLKY